MSAPARKESNPKDIIGSGKLPMGLVSGFFKAFTALALSEGMFKYGAHNYRAVGVRVSIYLDALDRHMECYKNGEWSDPVTGVPHLANAAACLCIIIDAHCMGKLVDDRPPAAPVADLIRDFNGKIPVLREMFKDHKPHHYTINDTKGE